MTDLRVAVIGAGYLGRFHAQKYAAMPDVELVGVMDIQRSQAEAVAAEVGSTAYTDITPLLTAVDAVSIVVPTAAHFETSRSFLDRGVDLLIEKPMTSTLDEADRLIEIAEANGAIIQVGHLERFNSAVVALEDIVRNPRFIESHRLSTFKNRGTDVSVVLDLMIHDIDIILNFVRSEVAEIHAAGIPVITEEIDIANARLEFANGCVANVTASRISAKNQRKIRLFQSDAYVSVDFASHDITIIKKEGGHQNPGDLIPGMAIDQRCFTKGDALDDELKSFVKAVRHRLAPEVTGEMGRDALKIALSIMGQIEKSSAKLLGL
ncbi:MAG: Gfo/Idh/MocA family oxidoreductase [Desulfosarcinaceae bacterium]|nr:Gfo/Idh/MocA family oxidoreductase [Desulfosarcinaceae bacterium]